MNLHLASDRTLRVSPDVGRSYRSDIPVDAVRDDPAVARASQIHVPARLRESPLIARLAYELTTGYLAGQVQLVGRTGVTFPLRVADKPAYQLADHTSRYGPDDPAIERLLWDHPAYPSLSFVAGPDRVPQMARFLTSVLDPRCFQHPSRPHRVSRLTRYLGVTPAGVGYLLGRRREPGPNLDRLRLLLSLCMGSGLSDPMDPGSMTYRIVLNAGDWEKGLVRAMARVIRLVWLDWLQRTDEASDIFDPRLLLHRRELVAYWRHIRQID